jgi:preprotein translocase subunit SecA
MPMIREERHDQVFRTAKEKFQAIIGDIRDCHTRGQPVLVGTTSIENSELLSGMLTKDKLPHQVLNAKQHAREAEIVAQAGRPKMVTIATNMAGRGTDIVLGGNVEKQCELIEASPEIPPEEKEARIAKLRSEWQQLHDLVIKEGGLHIVGTERHESRRVDNQLRGRSGRQGDPGSSRFYLSLEDPLLRIFAGERINRIMVMLKMPEGEPIEHRMVSRSLESAQRKVEARNFDIRKQLLEYDDVANDQRKTIYALRNELLESEDVSPRIGDLRAGVVADLFRQFVPEESVEEQWDIAGLETALKAELGLDLPLRAWLQKEPELGDEALLERITARADEEYKAKVPAGAEASFRQYERYVMLQILDGHWREHLAALDHLRQGIHLRGVRAEESEAGVQARSVRAVRRDAGGSQARGDEDADRGPDPHVGGDPSRRRPAARRKRADAARQSRGSSRGRFRRRGARHGRGEKIAAEGTRHGEDRPQRAVPLRLGEEIQALPRES